LKKMVGYVSDSGQAVAIKKNDVAAKLKKN
jgi:hypothetical protein